MDGLARALQRKWILLAFLAALPGGCASLTSPLADGVPVRRVPAELLAASRKDELTVPLHLLGQPAPDTYRLAPGDTLGVYIEGFLGDRNQPLPVYIGMGNQARDQRPLPPSTGYPVTVESNGTIDLPGVGPVAVLGRSIPEVREGLRTLYAGKKLIKPDTDRVLVTLLQPRFSSVLVLRQEAASFVYTPDDPQPGSKRGVGFQLDMPAYENDVLHALTRSGGLPGLDVYNEVIILRGCFRTPEERAALLAGLGQGRVDKAPVPTLPGAEVIHIPLRTPPGQLPCFRPEDVVLRTGDVLFLEARDDPYFFTAGLLPSARHVLPRDRDLDVLEAVAQVRGPLFNGAFGGSNLSGALIQPGIGNPSPSQLTVVRKTPGGGQVNIVVDLNLAARDPNERILIRNGDLLVLQEAPGESLARYTSQSFFNFELFWQVFHGRFGTGVINVAAPDRLPNRVGTVNFGSLVP